MIITVSCTSKINRYESNLVFIEDFGGKSDDNNPDDEAFKSAILYSFHNNKILKLKNGTYLIKNRILIDKLVGDFSMIGSENTILRIPEFGFLRLEAASIEKTLIANIESGSNMIEVNNVFGLKPNQTIKINSDSAWEMGWNYKESDTHIIERINGNKIYTKDPIIFNYKIDEENVKIVISEKASAKFENLSLIIDPDKSWLKTTAIELVSMAVNLNNILIRDLQNEIFHRGVSIVNSPEIYIYEMNLEGLEYGILMNFCRNIKINKIEAKTLRHAIVPANACINMSAANISGYNCQGVIDAHQSFNIHYDSIKDINATQFSNCRALGTKISNSFFSVDSSFYQDYAYWSNQLLTKEYEKLYENFDTEFENVTWIHSKPSDFNGLTCFSCRNFYIRNCTTHNVSVYGEIFGKALIKNSVIGNIRINSHNVEIDSCILDGRLFESANYLFRFSGAGSTKINYVNAKNYNSEITDMFEYFYNTSNKNSVIIKSSSFCRLRYWSEKLIYPNLDYTSLFIKDTEFIGFTKKLPKAIFNKNIVMNNFEKTVGLNFKSNNVE